jgi:hypothetical protein
VQGCTLTDLENLQSGQGGAASSNAATTVTTGMASNNTTSGPTAMGYAGVVLADAPISYWRLGDAGDKAIDEAAGANNGMYMGGVMLGSPGAIAAETNTAALLNGTDAYVDFGDVLGFPGNAAFSIEAWVAPTSLQGLRGIVTKSRFDNVSGVINGFRLTSLDGTVRFQRVSFDGDDGVASSTALPLGRYSHIVATYDGEAMALFVDAELVGSLPSSTPISSLGAFAVGADFMHESGPTAFFAGSFDEVAVYSYALPAARITAHYQAAQSP